MDTKKRRRYGLIPLILGGLVLLLGLVLMLRLPRGCQYLTLAEKGEGLTHRLESLSSCLSGSHWAVATRRQGMMLSSERAAGLSATVYAVGEGYFDLHHERLLEGRFPSGEDIRENDPCAVITDKAALRLFGGIAPLGQCFDCGGLRLKVIGVVSSGLRLGETDELVIFVPLGLAEKTEPTTLEVELPSMKAEDVAYARTQLEQWAPGGRFLTDSRSRMAALMPLWLVGLFAAVMALRLSLRGLITHVRHVAGRCREELALQETRHIWPKIAGRILLTGLFCCAWVVAFLLLLRYAVLPMESFPDWIPKRLTEGSAMAQTVKGLLQGASASVKLQSSRSVTAELCTGLMQWGCLIVVSSAALMRTGFAWQTKKKNSADME